MRRSFSTIGAMLAIILLAAFARPTDSPPTADQTVTLIAVAPDMDVGVTVTATSETVSQYSDVIDQVATGNIGTTITTSIHRPPGLTRTKHVSTAGVNQNIGYRASGVKPYHERRLLRLA